MTTLAKTNDTTIFYLEDIETTCGKNIQIPLSIKNNSGIASFCFRINYDNTVLEPVSIKKGVLLSEGMLIDNISNSTKENITLLWFSSNGDMIDDGTLAVINFKVLDTEKTSTELNLNYSPDDILNSDRVQVPCSVINSTISIEQKTVPPTQDNFYDYQIGDVDNDGRVTILDATTIQKYLVLLVDLNEKGLICADTDHDTRITILDATKIQRYLAELIPSL